MSSTMTRMKLGLVRLGFEMARDVAKDRERINDSNLIGFNGENYRLDLFFSPMTLPSALAEDSRVLAMRAKRSSNSSLILRSALFIF